MKKRSSILILVLVFTGIQFLYAEKTEKRDLPVFKEISLSTGATVYLTQGNIQKVELTGDAEALEKLITEVNNGKLIIKYPKSFNEHTYNLLSLHPFEKKHVDIHITMSEINQLSVSGTGSILASDLVDTKALDVSLSGTGNLKMNNLKTEKVSSHLSGTGTLFLSGQQAASEFNSSISGTGSVKALDFKADHVSVSISGTGSCSITANQKLPVRISGTGNVRYRGHPQVDSRVSGTGHVRAEK